MESLFNQNANQKIIDRINALTTGSKPQWGKMNVEQMLAHCRMPLTAAHGDVKMKRGLIGILFGGIAKKQLITENKPFKQNLPTDKNFIVADPENFEKEKQQLLERIQLFYQKGPDGITKQAHSFFGKMTPQEWDKLQWKHLDHHLRQFGV